MCIQKTHTKIIFIRNNIWSPSRLSNIYEESYSQFINLALSNNNIKFVSVKIVSEFCSPGSLLVYLIIKLRGI